jgi:ubiquinone biosynthesis protein
MRRANSVSDHVVHDGTDDFRYGTDDFGIGAFPASASWVVDPDAMPWRRGVDDLRRRTQSAVPVLLRHRRVPPLGSARVAATLMRAGAPWALRHRKDPQSSKAQAGLAARLRPAFERLGPTFIKLGQLIGGADNFLPDELVGEFKLCHDRVPAESFDYVREVVEAELGGPLRDLFAEFDRTPIAAASIAQTHGARLANGEEVVVKVQRPGIKKRVTRDLGILTWLAPILERHVPQARLANLPAYLALFAQTIVEELDFRLEAENMLDIARILATAPGRAVIVPRPHPTLVTPRVLVMERIRGFRTDEDQAIVDAGVDPTPVFRALMNMLIEGAMIHGVFHGDLHGGNMMITPTGQTCLFDFGITGRFDDDAARRALMGFMMSTITADIPAQLEYFRDLGGFPPDANLDKVRADLDLGGDNPHAASAEAVATTMRDTATKLVAHGGRMPKPLFLYLKGAVYLMGAIATLGADVDILQELSYTVDYLTKTHGEQFKTDIGLDVEATPVNSDKLLSLVKATAGVDADATSVSFRDLQRGQAGQVKDAAQAGKTD